ncbi:MAG: helix-hairpin-helix domain-containing protein [Chloroflexi bacterium]|nr:helix-hairpin-helix domain-containing protein [Chloroflexota bacterium]
MDLAMLGRTLRLVAAAACFTLGVLVLALGLAPRLLAPTAREAPPTVLEPLSELDAQMLPALDAPASDPPADLVVYVSGAVFFPDVYQLPPGARVKDLVEAAGGLRPDAAGEHVNLAEPLSDAQHIHIPTLAERSAAPASPAGAAAPAGGLLDLNRASAADLEELPGIGPTLAERIVARRTDQGPFRAVEELREVTGIGDKLFAQIAPLVTVEP